MKKEFVVIVERRIHRKLRVIARNHQEAHDIIEKYGVDRAYSDYSSGKKDAEEFIITETQIPISSSLIFPSLNPMQEITKNWFKNKKLHEENDNQSD